MQSSRRAFLLGRRPVRTAWDEMRLRLARVADGTLQDLGPNRARLTVRNAADVRQARALCAEYGVRLALAGTPLAESQTADAPQLPVLSLDPAALDGLTRVAAGWSAGPGCRAAELAAAGLPQFADAPAGQTLALWLAQCRPWPVGGTAASGVRELDLLLADGVAETFGPFGADDSRPLRSGTVQRLVPALFQLTAGADAAACLQTSRWPGRHRLDALRPGAPHTVNLAHLLLGHGGKLAWVEQAVLVPFRNDTFHGVPAPAPDEAAGAATAPAAARLDRRIVDLFDPAGLYGGS